MSEDNTQRTQEAQMKPAESKKRRISKGKIVLIIIILFVAWFGAIQYMSADRYTAVVNVIEGVDKVGVNPTTELLDFGDLSRDTAQTRTVTLVNTGKMTKYIQIWKKGELAEIMTLSKNNFELKSGEEYRLEFTVKIPSSAEYRKYEGSVAIFNWPKVW